MTQFPALLLVLLATGATLLVACERQRSDAPATGLPWQIEVLPAGETRVFGITPGRTPLGAAIEQLGDGMDLAIIAAPRETGTLEAYYSHYAAGPVTGKLILVLDVPEETLLAMRERGTRDGGTRRHYLHPDDLPLAYTMPVAVITFMPGTDLDEEIAQARFGDPAEVIPVSERQKHLLYPDKGLDLVLDADARDLLQYLSPQRFDDHRDRVRRTADAGEQACAAGGPCP